MIDKEIIEMEKICRSCMSESAQMRNVFEIKEAQEGNSLQLAEMLMACTSIQIASDDGLPVQLCQACETKLDCAFEFKKQCEKTDTTLRQISNILMPIKTIVATISTPKGPCTIKLEESLDNSVQLDLSTLIESNGGNSDTSYVNCSEERITNNLATYTCSYCEKVLRTKKGLICHQRRHTGEHLHYCHLCPAKFTRGNHLNRHLQLHNKSIKYVPQESNSTQKRIENGTRSELYKNENDTDTEDLDYKDEDYIQCKKDRFKSLGTTNNDREKGKRVMECEFCDRKFKYRKSFKHHMQAEHGMSDDSDVSYNVNSENVRDDLDEAPETFTAENSFSTKSIQANSQASDDENNLLEEEPEIIIPIIKRKQYTCHVCTTQFTRANHLTRHMFVHRAVLIHKCVKCDKAFATPSFLDKHMKEDHINKPYLCNICNKQFSRGELFIRHLRAHDTGGADGIHKCSLCEVTFTRSDHLARHIKIHLQQDKRHVCGDCGKAFNRLDNLRTHQKIHSGLKDNARLHLCVYCGKEFNSSSNMIVHMRRHTGERPYKCSICNKGFPRSHDLKCHERTHSGEKPYLCTLCGKSFNKSNKLLRHTRVHTGERPYICNICGRAFTQSNDLALHTRRHTGARPYVCGVCPARFIQSGQLKVHRRSTNHWMDIPPDLKGGHRVEQVTPIADPQPIKFKTHGKCDVKLNDEDIKGEPRNIIQHVNIMGMDSEVAVIPQTYVLDSSKLLQSTSGGGFLVFTSVLNSAGQTILEPDLEKYKEETQSGSSIQSDDLPVDGSKIEVVNGNNIIFSPEDTVHSYSVIPTDHYNFENYD